MKKRIIHSVLALALTVAGLAGQINIAEAKTHDDISWNVTFDGKEVKSDFSERDINGSIPAVMPGDTIVYTINYSSSVNADFYLNADIINTLEEKTADNTDSQEAKNGAYSYKITYGPTGDENTIYDSELVGVDESDAIKGLKQVDGEDKFFELGQVNPGPGQKVKITIQLDGNTQDNSYMYKLAALKVKLGAQVLPPNKVVTNTNTNKVVYTVPGGSQIVTITDTETPLAIVEDTPLTGDYIIPTIICVVGLIMGIILIGLYFYMALKQREEVV